MTHAVRTRRPKRTVSIDFNQLHSHSEYVSRKVESAGSTSLGEARDLRSAGAIGNCGFGANFWAQYLLNVASRTRPLVFRNDQRLSLRPTT